MPGAKPTLSAQLALTAMAALMLGAMDAALITAGLAGARGAFQFVPGRIWIVAPLVWMLVAAVLTGVVMPFVRRQGGLLVAAVLAAAFIAIRLAGRPGLLLAAMVALTMLVWIASARVARWTARPRRALLAALLIVIPAGGTIAATLPRTSPAAVRQRPDGPNVIVIFLDTVRYDALFDANGNPYTDLPTLTRLASQSTVFTRAFAPSPWTLPSHLSALTGVPVHELGVSFDAQVYRGNDPTLAERFHRRGYRTAAVISNTFLNPGAGVARGFDHFEHATAGLDVCRTAPGVIAERHWPWFSAAICNWTATEVTARARALMDDTDAPFFLMLNYMDAHEPYYVERSCGEPSDYRAAIRCLDRHLAPIVNWRSARRPTVLVLVGDHGEQFGEHGLTAHGNSLYAQLLHVPLIVRAANPSPRRIAQLVSTTTLPTLIDGRNPAVERDDPIEALLHPPAAAHRPSQWSALDGEWHLIVREQGADELFNFVSDPSETRNRIAEEAANPTVVRLREAIARMRRAPKPDLQRFRSLGYVH